MHLSAPSRLPDFSQLAGSDFWAGLHIGMSTTPTLGGSFRRQILMVHWTTPNLESQQLSYPIKMSYNLNYNLLFISHIFHFGLIGHSILSLNYSCSERSKWKHKGIRCRKEKKVIKEKILSIIVKKFLNPARNFDTQASSTKFSKKRSLRWTPDEFIPIRPVRFFCYANIYFF